MLGDLLAAARDGTSEFTPWLRRTDPQMADKIDRAAEAEEMTPNSYVRSAVADFARFASEEDWATLTSALKQSDDPGTACLLAMVDWRLTASACSAHSHQAHGQKGTDSERSDQ